MYLAVDGQSTVEIPQSRPVTTTESECHGWQVVGTVTCHFMVDSQCTWWVQHAEVVTQQVTRHHSLNQHHPWGEWADSTSPTMPYYSHFNVTTLQLSTQAQFICQLKLSDNVIVKFIQMSVSNNFTISGHINYQTKSSLKSEGKSCSLNWHHSSNIHCVQKKTPTHIFFHISMNDV